MVFTGIVEEMGEVVSLVQRPDVKMWDGSVGEGWILTVSSKVVLDDDTYDGCSVAVNGTCLTVTRFDAERDTKSGGGGGARTADFGLSPETLRRTNLGDLRPGDAVNLERSMSSAARNSGHVVQGHVDCTGTIAEKWRDGDSLWIKVSAPADTLNALVPKGYVAVDGTSLTVCEVNWSQGWFTFMLVAYTQKKIIVPGKDVGARVNLEPDVLGKYAGSYVKAALGDMEARVVHAERTAKLAGVAAAAALLAVTMIARRGN